MQVVILCGGKGLRMKELTGEIPKPLVPINGKPILWYIMKHYSLYGFNDFVLALGYKGEKIIEYFTQYRMKNSDFVIDLAKNEIEFLRSHSEDWRVTLVDTGAETMTGSRIKQLEKYITGDTFMLTYGDGLCDLNINNLLSYHNEKNKIATVTGIKPESRYGIITTTDGIADAFCEKPLLNNTINGGYFVFKRDFFNYVDINGACVLEEGPLKKLVTDGELAVFEHTGFWLGIDTQKDIELAEKYVYHKNEDDT